MHNLKLLVIDVDGTMTDAGIYYDNNGNELKKFCTRDAAGFFAAKHVGIKIMVLTGRKCRATEIRMNEMKVDYLHQDVKNKLEFLDNFVRVQGLSYDEVAYIGDDLNDYQVMKKVGYKACPKDACNEIKAICDYVSICDGGHGAVRDVVEHLLLVSGEWSDAVSEVYNIGI